MAGAEDMEGADLADPEVLSKKSSHKNQKEYKFHPHAFGKQQYASYASVKDVIVQNIQKSWEGGYDIGKLLRDLDVVDLTPHKPTQDITTKTDPAAAQRDQEGFNIKYQEKLRIF